MTHREDRQLDTDVGKQTVDATGSPIGVAKIDVQRSYAGVGELLAAFINEDDQGAWNRIREKIDTTYACLDWALGALEEETGFGRQIVERVRKGQKLLFKPNLVTPTNIHAQTHGPDMGSTACTEWPFVAALMRWFRDKLNISYHDMAIGEAATTITATARFYSRMVPTGQTVTPEAVIEGRSGDFYGGWGFYFARKYLAESLRPDQRDDPMQGYKESVAGLYIPPGEVEDRLMVYDLNRIFDDPAKGREIDVPGGVNYRSITLHKAVVGGDPDAPEDRRAYPGCVLVNVPKLKVHNMALFTNVIKNLGIGLYPMQHASTGGTRWDYSRPHREVPGVKGAIPHEIWVADMDEVAGTPRKDEGGGYILEKTGGLNATMIDIIRAVEGAGILMLHVVDGIESTNHDHTGSTGTATKEPEGMVFAGLDPVATDLLSARYMFTNIPLQEALEAGLEDGDGGVFAQKVPVPTVEGSRIVTREGYDAPLARDVCFAKAEERGLGQRDYHAVGRDGATGCPIVSIRGHLGTEKDGSFTDLFTSTLFYDDFKMGWDMQKTTLSYFACIDALTGTSLRDQFLAAYDDDRDGVITYEENGRRGISGIVLHLIGKVVARIGSEEAGLLKGNFDQGTTIFRLTDTEWNEQGEDLLKEFGYAFVCNVAYQMSLMETELPDLFVPGMTWGRGNWPSFELARHALLGLSLYGEQYPEKIRFPSIYGLAFSYADQSQNEGRYTGAILGQPSQEGLDGYLQGVLEGRLQPLDFVLYVPAGFESLAGATIPNVEVAADPSRVFTASFDGGTEVWSSERPLE